MLGYRMRKHTTIRWYGRGASLPPHYWVGSGEGAKPPPSPRLLPSYCLMKDAVKRPKSVSQQTYLLSVMVIETRYPPFWLDTRLLRLDTRLFRLDTRFFDSILVFCDSIYSTVVTRYSPFVTRYVLSFRDSILAFFHSILDFSDSILEFSDSKLAFYDWILDTIKPLGH